MKALVYSVSAPRWVATKLLGCVSSRAFHSAISPLQLRDRPEPDLPGPGWVRLKTILGGICGTDLALVGLRNHPSTFLRGYIRLPAVLGHENVAVIDKIGPEVSGWSVGQRVCIEPALGCAARGAEPVCRQCAAGCNSLCEHPGDERFPPRALIGLNTLTGGGWGPYFVAHQSQLHAVPDSISDEMAVIVDPVASATHAVLRRRPQRGEAVLVQGSGLIAMGVIASIRALGHDNPITAIVRHEYQAQAAKRLGATSVLRFSRRSSIGERCGAIAQHTGGRRIPAKYGNHSVMGGFDLTYECTGTGIGMSDAAKWTRSRGVFVAVGTSTIGIVDTTAIWFDELNVIGANGRQIEHVVDIETGECRRVHGYDLVFEWLEGERLDLSPLKVARYRLTDYRTAFRHLLGHTKHPIHKAVFEH